MCNKKNQQYYSLDSYLSNPLESAGFLEQILTSNMWVVILTKKSEFHVTEKYFGKKKHVYTFK